MFCRGDVLGKIMAFISLLPHVEFLCLLSASLFAPKQIQLPVWRVVFLLSLGERLNAVLKNIIAQQRPVSELVAYGAYGMPSAHAQFQSTLMVSTLRIIFSSPEFPSLRKGFLLALSAALLSSVVLVGISRVYHPYHTCSQVILGGVVGILIGLNIHNPVLDRLAEGASRLFDFLKKTYVFQ